MASLNSVDVLIGRNVEQDGGLAGNICEPIAKTAPRNRALRAPEAFIEPDRFFQLVSRVEQMNFPATMRGSPLLHSRSPFLALPLQRGGQGQERVFGLLRKVYAKRAAIGGCPK